MATDDLLILYSRADCHLCDQVVMMMDRLGVRWRPVDIDSDPELARRYGVRIPVLQRPGSGRELDFPFSEEDLRRFTLQ